MSKPITETYAFITPEDNDFYDVEDQNINWQTAEQILKDQGQQISDSLAIATTEKLGRIKVGSHLSVTPEGVLSGAAPYTHPGSGTNPHGTTKTDVGLGSVLNYGIATTVEAQAGLSDSKYMTPLKVADYLSTKGLGATSFPYMSENLNTLAGNISVYGASMAHAPDADYWYVEQLVHGQGAWQYQRATGLTTTRKRERWLLNGTWTEWRDPSGGDIVGKVYNFETLQYNVNANTGAWTVVKNYTNAKGGMVSLAFAMGQVLRITVDGVIKINGIEPGLLSSAILNLDYTRDRIAIPFKNTILIEAISFNTMAQTNRTASIHYYTNE